MYGPSKFIQDQFPPFHVQVPEKNYRGKVVKLVKNNPKLLTKMSVVFS